RLRRAPLAQRFSHPVQADDRPEDLDHDRGKVPFEDQRYEDQHRADQIGEGVAPILGAEPALLIGEIGGDKDRRAGETNDVIWLYVYPHRRAFLHGSNACFTRLSFCRRSGESSSVRPAFPEPAAAPSRPWLPTK